MSQLFDAIEFATHAHSGQYRKATRIPYIIHPLNVVKLLIESDCPEVVVIAGALHDTVEDTAVTAGEIRARYGNDVADLVDAVTEPPRAAPWEDRKREILVRLATAPPPVLLVEAADKLDNLHSIQADYARQGDAVWDRFNRPRPYQHWHYASLAQVFMQRIPAYATIPLLNEFVQTVEDVFGTNIPPPVFDPA